MPLKKEGRENIGKSSGTLGIGRHYKHNAKNQIPVKIINSQKPRIYYYCYIYININSRNFVYDTMLWVNSMTVDDKEEKANVPKYT